MKNIVIFILISVQIILALSINTEAHHVNGRQYWYTTQASISSVEGYINDAGDLNVDGNIFHGSYYSNSMEHSVGYYIYLPPGYPDNGPYPVVYFLHGINGNESNYFGQWNSSNTLLNSEGFVKSIVGNHGTADPKDTIIVFLNGGARSYYVDYDGYVDVNTGEDHHSSAIPKPTNLPNYPGDPYPQTWPNGTYDFKILSRTTIIDELIPHIDSTYSTIDNRSGRAIEGFSMGGGGAVRLAFQNPDKFCSVVGYATAGLDEIPASFVPEYGGPFQVQTDQSTYLATTDPYRQAIIDNNLKIRIVGGGNDTGWGNAGLALASDLENAGIPATNIDAPPLIPGIGHNLFDLNQSAGIDSFNFHWDCFDSAIVPITTPSSTPVPSPSPTPATVSQTPVPQTPAFINYFPFYATDSSLGSQEWVSVGNPSNESTANVNIRIGNSINEDFSLAPGSKITPKWPIVDGPVVVTSDIQVFSTKRTVLNGSFNEHEAVSSEDLYNSFYYPFYATSSALGSQDWVLVGNPSATVSANVNIKIGSSIDQNYTIAPGEKITPKWEIVDGPVEITSDIPIYSTKRTILNGSFNEHKGITNSDIVTGVYYPFYATDSALGSQEWVLVGNPSATVSANVNIKIGSSIDQNYIIAPGEKITPKWGIVDGPVKITSDSPIYSTKRTILNGSFNEHKGITSSDIVTSIYYPFYATDSALGSQEWVLVGNPSATVSANVNIKIGTSIDQNYIIAPGEKITPKWGIVDGPVKITSDIPIYSTKRTVLKGSFNEFEGNTLSNVAIELLPVTGGESDSADSYVLIGIISLLLFGSLGYLLKIR